MSEEPTRTNGSGALSAVDSPVLEAEVRALEAEFKTLETSILLARAAFMRQAGITFEGARDEYTVLGYPRIITNRQYREEYHRGGIAGRVVDVMPDATWRGDPAFEIVEDEDPEKDTPFETAWKELDKKHQIGSKLQRVDKLSRLSTFAVLLIGAAGELNTELPRASGRGLLYLMPFSGGGGPDTISSQRSTPAYDFGDCSIYEYETDSQSERFGLPKTYQLRRVSLVANTSARTVHWSRIVHVAEGLLDDEVFGQPALERIWNLLIDLRKVTGGGAEAFWLRANQITHVDVDKELTLEKGEYATVIAKLKEQTEAIKHKLSNWIQTRGVKIDNLGSDTANFNQPADTILTQIAGSKAIPKRILTGSEMGELASSQDRDNWKDQVNGRQTQYAGPYIVRVLVDRFIKYGYLPAPAKGAGAYAVEWPHIQTMTEAEKAEGAKKWADVNTAYGGTVFTAEEIRDKWYGMAPTDAKDEDTQPWRATLALKMAEANKTQGAIVFTDDEIRETCYGWAPLKPEQKVPITAPERVTATAPTPAADAGGKAPIPGKVPGPVAVPRAASADDEELIRVLAAAIEAGNSEVVNKIIGLEEAGHPFHGNQWVEAGGMGVQAKQFEGPSRADERKAAAKEAHKQLMKAGFVKQTAEKKHTPSQPLGRSEAYSGTYDKRETIYQHPDGRSARMIERWSKYGTHSVAVHHARSAQDSPHKYGTTQVQLPPNLAAQLLAIPIDDADLYTSEGGRETDAHITVAYGLIDPDYDKLRAVLSRQGWTHGVVKLGKTETFKTPDYDVVYVVVQSQDLANLNLAVTSGAPIKPSDYMDYVPHATVAYVEAGKGEKYVGLTDLDGATFIFDTVTMVTKEGERSEVRLA